MREQLEKRRQELRAEFEGGQKQLAELEAQTEALRTTLLRISGAIQVLEEMLAAPRMKEENGAGAVDKQQVSAPAN
jgi:prefoldin subunit 5